MEKNIIESEAKKLLDRVWKTKKIRMVAEARRLTLKKQTDLLLNLTTIWALETSFFTFLGNSNFGVLTNSGVSILSFVLSLGAVIISLIVTGYDYVSEANEFKNSYIELGKVENEIDILLNRLKLHIGSCDEIIAQLASIKNNYTDVLSRTMNHTDLDFLFFKRAQLQQEYEHDDSCKSSWKKNWMKNLWYYFCRYSIDIVNLIILFSILYLLFVSIIFRKGS